MSTSQQPDTTTRLLTLQIFYAFFLLLFLLSCVKKEFKSIVNHSTYQLINVLHVMSQKLVFFVSIFYSKDEKGLKENQEICMQVSLDKHLARW